jgi:hypothetical protein
MKKYSGIYLWGFRKPVKHQTYFNILSDYSSPCNRALYTPLPSHGQQQNSETETGNDKISNRTCSVFVKYTTHNFNLSHYLQFLPETVLLEESPVKHMEAAAEGLFTEILFYCAYGTVNQTHL